MFTAKTCWILEAGQQATGEILAAGQQATGEILAAGQQATGENLAAGQQATGEKGCNDRRPALQLTAEVGTTTYADKKCGL